MSIGQRSFSLRYGNLRICFESELQNPNADSSPEVARFPFLGAMKRFNGTVSL